MDRTSNSHTTTEKDSEKNFTSISSTKKTPKPGNSSFSNLNNSPQQDDTAYLLGVFVNEDGQKYYLKKWAKTTHTWNWAAFFFSFWWLGYRRMYIPLITILGGFLFLHLTAALFHFDFSKVDGLLRLIVIFALGITGNSIYKKHALKIIAKYKSSCEDRKAAEERIAEKGGVSFESFMLSNGIIILYAIIIGML